MLTLFILLPMNVILEFAFVIALFFADANKSPTFQLRENADGRLLKTKVDFLIAQLRNLDSLCFN